MKPPITERPDDSWLDRTFFENQTKVPPEQTHLVPDGAGDVLFLL